jgi:hypothetical protein
LFLSLHQKSFKIKSDFSPDSVEGKVEALLESFSTVCRKDGLIGSTNYAVHKIEAQHFPGIAARPLHVAPKYSEEIQRQVDGLLKHGLIPPSVSSCGFNLVLVPKHDSSIRMTVNYKRLNAAAENNSAPMPNLRMIPTGGYYSTNDFKSGYWQIRMHSDSMHQTAFYANGSLYEWLMLFRLKRQVSRLSI